MYLSREECTTWYYLKRRDATKVIHDILVLAEKGVPKTRIVYQANLNFTFAQPFFDFLISRGYIAKDAPPKGRITVYQLTERGQNLLKLLRQVETELREFMPRAFN